MPRIGFFVEAGRHFDKRMETHKFVDTNLLIDPYPFQLGVSLLQELRQQVRGLLQTSSSTKNVAKICKNNARPVYLQVKWKFATFYVLYPRYSSSNTYPLFL